jgi:hypothetical protein
LRNVAILHSLRKSILTDPQLDTKLARAQRGVGLPDWWAIAGVDMDRGFLLGTHKYGMNQDFQFRVMLDPELPFRAVVERILKLHGFHQVDLAAYEQRRTAALAVDEKKGGPVARSSSTNALAGDDGLASVTSGRDEEAAAGSSLSAFDGDVELEDVIGWPRDLIRSRWLEYLLELSLCAPAALSTPALKRKAEDHAAQESLDKRAKLSLTSSLDQLSAELGRYCSSSNNSSADQQALAKEAADALARTRLLLEELQQARGGHAVPINGGQGQDVPMSE